MKTIGVIAECNPFHNGHAYLLQQAKKLAGADYCILLMSGDYVQRGMPAQFDKYKRTRAALACGADLVLELPVCYATAGAERFARGGVSILSHLGVVDALAFGCETDDPTQLSAAAKLLSDEPDSYRHTLKQKLSEGLSFPAASAEAVCSCMPYTSDAEHASLSSALQAPNNILAIAYLRAILQQNSPLTPLPVKRVGSGYHSDSMQPPYASASALRSYISTHQEFCRDAKTTADDFTDPATRLAQFIPKAALHTIYPKDGCCQPACEAPFSLLLHQKLLSLTSEHLPLTTYADVSEPLAHKIENTLYDYRNIQQFAKRCLSKEYTLARIQRALLHILLDIRDVHMDAAASLSDAPYVRMLGCRPDAAPLLAAIKKTVSLPFLTKPAYAADQLSETANMLWQLDVSAAHTYQACMTSLYDIPFASEYTRQICGLADHMQF